MSSKKIALSAGHYNSTGGTADEKKIVGPIYVALINVLRQYGHDVRGITPITNGIAKDYPGSLGDVAAQVVKWHNQGWAADLFLEIHAEWNALGINGSGAFVVYPDTGNDVDTVVRQTLGPAIARSIAEEFDIRIRDGGVMSERQTSVGASGGRLGIFRMTEAIKATCTRGIVEIMRFNQPEDRDTITKATDFTKRCAIAIADAVHQHFGGIIPNGAIPVDSRFKATYVASGGMWLPDKLTPGLPITPAFEWNSRLVQLYERAGVSTSDNGHTVAWLLNREYNEALAAWLTKP